MMAKVRYMPDEYRMFNTFERASDYVKSRVGLDPIIIDETYVTSKDRSVKITVTGCDVKELLR